jgi:hypothetical protein
VRTTECVSSAEVRRIRLFAEYLNFQVRRFDESEMSQEHLKPDAGLSWGHLPLFSSSLDKDNSVDDPLLVASVEVRKN